MDAYMYTDPFSVCFNTLKIKYKDYDESLSSKNFLIPTDKVNVFINLETVLKNLSMIPQIEEKIIIQRDFHEIMISNILNLVAHYKKFFIDNGLDTKVYIYNTDLDSDEFNQYKYNDEYRSYYLQKYNENPRFALLSDNLKLGIFPNVKTFCEFIPNVYYISSKNIEGSLVPYIISQYDKSRKNLIIGGELYDTQYSIIPNFVNYYIKRSFTTNAVYTDINGYVDDIMKRDKESADIISDKVFDNYSIYCSLISTIGDKSRNIEKLTGYGPKKLQKCIEAGIAQNIIQDKTTNPEILGDIFHDSELKEQFVNNFYCSSIISMYDELNTAQINSITQQIVDRIDINTIQSINSTRFYNHPLLLPILLS